jgi:hypothetical protein
MSVSGIIDKYSNDPDYKNKIYPDLIPWNHPLGQQNLGEVLATGNQALSPTTGLPQDATDFATLGCVKIETGTVGMGNQPALVIGEAGDILQIKGATLLGSLLVGNGVNTETLTAGPNSYILQANSGALNGLGVELFAQRHHIPFVSQKHGGRLVIKTPNHRPQRSIDR